MEPLKIYPYLVSRLGQARIAVMDGECVDTAADYRTVIEELLSLATPPLQLDRFESTDADPRVLQPTISGVPLTFTVEGDTDWVDVEPLVAGLNQYFIQQNLPFRFYSFYDAVQFGQETGFCFADKTVGDEILAELRAVYEKLGGEGYIGSFTDGVEGVGTEYDEEDDEEDEEWDDTLWETEDEDDEEEEDDDDDDDDEDEDDDDDDEDEDDDDDDDDDDDEDDEDEDEDDDDEKPSRK